MVGLVFGGHVSKESPYAVLGVPVEGNPSFREGSRWGPPEIRKASNYIEFRSELSGLDADEVGFEDLGDVAVLGDKKKTLDMIYYELTRLHKVPILLGGEHTITYSAVRALDPDCLVVFDAHLDVRDEYLGDPWSHACWLRRLLEKWEGKTAVVGARAYVSEEVEFLKEKGVFFAKNARGYLSRFLDGCKNVYVSVDMDYFDPSVVPGVSNPEPGGGSFGDFLNHLSELVRYKLAGLDVVELAPTYDHTGISAVYAARVIVEIATSLKPLSRALRDPCC